MKTPKKASQCAAIISCHSHLTSCQTSNPHSPTPSTQHQSPHPHPIPSQPIPKNPILHPHHHPRTPHCSSEKETQTSRLGGRAAPPPAQPIHAAGWLPILCNCTSDFCMRCKGEVARRRPSHPWLVLKQPLQKQHRRRLLHHHPPPAGRRPACCDRRGLCGRR